MNSINKNRITYIEPNEYAGLFAKRKNSNIINQNELSWNQEDLVMSADLQVIIPRREDAGQTSYMVKVDGSSIKVDDGLYGRYVSYMGGVPYDNKNDSQSFLTNNYTNISYQEIVDNKVIDKESLGITSIDINFDAHFFPMVTINFTDVRGAALFMLSEEEYQNSLDGKKQFDSASSFFKALFHFPYPRFLLSVKGFYGTKVTFQLAVSNFRSAFKPENGSYDITVQFIGYIYGLYTDLPFNLVMAAPYYNNGYWEEQKAQGVFRYVNSDGSAGNPISTYVQFLGKMEAKELDANALDGANTVKSYSKTLKAIETLKKNT